MADRIDDLYSEKWFADMEKTIDLLQKQEAAILAVNAAMKAGAGDARGAKTLEDLAAAQSKVNTASQQAAAGFDDFNTALKQAEALKAQYNGSTKEMVTITLNSARAARELAKAADLQAAAARKAQIAAAATEKTARGEANALKQLTDERAILNKALKEAEVRYANLFSVAGKTNAATVEAKNTVLGIRKAMDDLNHAIGRYGDNVGNYAGKFNGLGFSIRNIASELPNAGISFRTFAQSISNNIGPLSDAITQARIQNAALAASGQATVSVGKQIAQSIFSWQTAILALVAAFVFLAPKIEEYVSNMFSSKKALDALKQSQERLNEALKSGEYQDAVKQVEELRINVELAKKGFLDKTKVVHQYNETIGLTTGKVKTLNEVEDFLIKNADAYVKMMLYKTAATLALNEAAKKVIENQTEIEKKETTGKFFSGIASKTEDEDARRALRAVQQNADNRVKVLEKQTDKELDIVRKFQKKAAEIAKNNDFDLFGGTQDDKTKAKKTKKVKEKEIETEDIYKILLSQMENEAQIQKDIADNTELSLAERLRAYDAYTQEQIAMVGLTADNEAAMITWINKITLKALKEREKMVEDSAKVTAKANKEAADSMADAWRIAAEEQAKADEAQFQGDKAKREKVYGFVDDLAAAYSGFTAQRVQEIDEEIEAIRKRRDAEMEAYETSADFQFATEQEKALKIAAINAKARQEEEKQEQERRQAIRTDAILHKAITIAKIAIETALATIHQATSGDPYTAFFRAAGVAALGAAQIAAAYAQPIPEYAEGTGPDGTPESGPARVSEEGRELGITKDGKVFLTPDSETITYLSKGTRIVPHAQTEELLKYYALGIPSLRMSNGKEYPMDKIMDGAASKIVDAIDRKRFPAQQQKPGWWDKYEYTHTR